MRKIPNFFGLNKTPGRVNLLRGIGFAYWAFPSTAGDDQTIANVLSIGRPTRYTGTSELVPSWMVANFPDATVIAFAGTTEAGQWLSYATELGVVACADVGGMAYRPFETWANEIADRLASQVPATGPMAFVGHSLGGVMAHLVAAKIAVRQTRLVSVYTSGCPLLGDDEFTRLARPVAHNVIVASDVIPMLPPAAFSSRLFLPGAQRLLPPMFRPGHDWYMPSASRLRPNASTFVLPGSPLLWARNIPAGLLESHPVGNYFKMGWDLCDYDDRSKLAQWAQVVSQFWGIQIQPA